MSRAIPQTSDVAIVGGGFYGLRIASVVAASRRSTVVFERASRFLSRASFNNQARIHGGYHYPRSILTALRARQHYRRFEHEFAGAVDRGFQHVYAIARQQTKIRAGEFFEFCKRISAPIAPAPRAFADRFDPHHVERSFLVEEGVFNAHRLADQALEAAVAAGVQCYPCVDAVAVEPGRARRLRVRWQSSSTAGETECDWVVSATYAALNDLLVRSGLQQVPLIHELTEIAIVQPPPLLQGYGVTVMDGPFWSCVPFPVYGAHSLSHVRYTPHRRWHSGADLDTQSRTTPDASTNVSHAALMQRDAERILPALRDARYVTSLWETKTILPRSDADDSRPILVRQHADAPGLVSVLGAKIDSVYDVEDELRDVILSA